MLSKLIKYELKATSRFMLLLYGLLLFFSVMTALILHFNMDGSGELNIGTSWGDVSIGGGLFLEILAMFIIFICMALNVATICAMFFYAINRFRTNLLGNEGYLMHTLPVSVRDNILAKNIVSTIWTMIGLIAALLSVLIISFGVLGVRLFPEIHKLFIDSAGAALIKSTKFWLICVKLLICIIISTMSKYFHLYASMAIGYSKNKHCTAASVGVFIGFSIIQLLLHAQVTNFFDTLSRDIWFNTAFAAITGFAFYGITHYFMSRKLNI